MTVSTTTSTITYIGNGATTIFSFPFIGVNASDIEVTYVDAAGVSTILNPSQYTLVLNPAPLGSLWGIGGSVTYPITGSPVTPIQVGTSIAITRIVPFEQTVSIANQGAFYPQAVEKGLDLLELQIQQIETGLGYTLRTPVSDPYPPNVLPSYIARANGYLAFDANGQPIVISAPSVTPTPGQFATPRRIVTAGTTTVNVLATDSFSGISIYQSSTPVTTVQLPEGYGPFPVFDGSLNAGTYPIRILPPAGKTILGQTQYYLAFDGQSATFMNDGTQILVQ
jgi:hypothetical protein